MDEFMVSGETMVRDLQFGLARGARARRRDGRRLPPRHVRPRRADAAAAARSPGIEHAVVWRGVPAAVEQTAFWWEAPDGSRVRAEYLYGSYSNGRDIPDDAKRLVLRARRLRARARRRAPRRHAADERHRPPDAAAVARPRRRRGERDAGRLRVRRHVAARVPAPTSRPTGLRDGRRRAALRRARQPAHGRRRRTASTCTRRARRPSGRSRRRAEPLTRAVPPRRRSTRTRSLDVAWRNLVLQQRARLVVRVQRRRGRRPGASCATRSPPDRRRARRATRSHALARAGRRAAPARPWS